MASNRYLGKIGGEGLGMANPWDPLPIPIRGDLDKTVTYEGLGRLIVRWEDIDFSLARIYSILVGDPDGDALREYGKGRTVPEKIGILRAAMDEKWAVRRHSQKLEGRFDKLLQEVDGFSERRNEFAHAILHQGSMFTFFQERTDLPPYRAQFALIPAYHVLKRYNPNGMPKFMYTEDNMKQLLARLATNGGIGSGTIQLVSNRGLSCVGKYIYIDASHGRGNLDCNNGSTGEFEFTASAWSSGYGSGILDGRLFKFTFGSKL